MELKIPLITHVMDNVLATYTTKQKTMNFLSI